MSAKPIGINPECRVLQNSNQPKIHSFKLVYFFIIIKLEIMESNSITAYELLNSNNDPKPQQLLEGVFESTGLACIAGSTDTGKSMLLRDLCIAITQEEETFLGFKLNTKSHTAIFVSTEDSKAMTTHLLGIQYEGLLLS